MSDRKTFRDLADPDAAAAAIADLPIAPEPPVEAVPLDDAAGRILAERIDAGIDVPGFDRASLDGYALRAGDTAGADEADPVRLEVVGTLHAGEAPGAAEVDDGEAVEVSTGAVMPPGADAMVPIERIDEIASESGAVSDVDVRTAVAPRENVMPAGADLAAGQRALGPGTRLTPREVGLLAALGEESVPVRARPTVGVLSTGAELVPPGEPLDHDSGQIHDVNAASIAAAAREAGADVQRYSTADDDPEALAESLRSAAPACDLLLTSGSTSAGAVDALHSVLEAEGELLLHGVALKPGKPTLVGRLGDCGYVGLPGYPVSAMMVFRTLVAPAIREAAGRPEPERASVEAELLEEARFEPGRRRLLPVGLVEAWSDATTAAGDPDGDRTPLTYPVDRGSGATTSLSRADGLVTVPAETSYVAPGERVTVELFSPAVRPPSLLAIGEDDPGAAAVMDALDRPRYLPDGTAAGVRRLRAGVPDVAVVAGEPRRDAEGPEIAAWEREWGLAVPAGTPEDVATIEDLAGSDLPFANLASGSGLRAALDDRLDAAGIDPATIEGYGVGLRGHESPARRVLTGDAAAGLGLRATAERLDLGFVPFGTQRVRLIGNPDRSDAAGRSALQGVTDRLPELLASISGYEAA
ncbi:molybdopterin biosynthesis protein [Salinarchaeum sp. Harcht-Bsk1]|uniref:molybdopterin biosynthesis protein n=1 Tax=Salinarchaeum sp. Harcht-Bsk1 TaxID=1333523 RepID=UPI000677D2A7|nr:molybdopterin biosynthesis protein [Salinarchaeum sp. Harcht-Bsk1]